jgi:hypothetical protein
MLRMVRTIAILLAAVTAAKADFTDPPNLHINGPGGFAQSGGGTDWVTLPTFNGTFSVQDVSNATETISPWHLIIAVPNVTGSLADTITKVGTTNVSISPLFDGNFTAGSVYDALGVTGSGIPNSLSIGNFRAAFTAVTGLPAPASYGLFDFTITPTSLALLNGVTENVNLSGLLPAGSVIFAYGTGADGTLFTTSFTNAGVVNPTAVPAPTAMALAAVGIVCLAPSAYRRRRRRDMTLAMA